MAIEGHSRTMTQYELWDGGLTGGLVWKSETVAAEAGSGGRRLSAGSNDQVDQHRPTCWRHHRGNSLTTHHDHVTSVQLTPYNIQRYANVTIIIVRANCTNFSIAEKFRNFTELHYGHATLWNFADFTFCWTMDLGQCWSWIDYSMTLLQTRSDPTIWNPAWAGVGFGENLFFSYHRTISLIKPMASTMLSAAI